MKKIALLVREIQMVFVFCDTALPFAISASIEIQATLVGPSESAANMSQLSVLVS